MFSGIGPIGRVLMAMAIAGVVSNLQAEPVDYLREIKPVLKERCFACHGALKQKSGLRLDTARLIRQGGDNGAAVTPGQAEASVLLKRVLATDLAERMPPEGEPLKAEQIKRIRAWISQGAASPDDEQPERGSEGP